MPLRERPHIQPDDVVVALRSNRLGFHVRSRDLRAFQPDRNYRTTAMFCCLIKIDHLGRRRSHQGLTCKIRISTRMLAKELYAMWDSRRVVHQT
jgi:hypothetical protein